jgi:hypothetical protein
MWRISGSGPHQAAAMDPAAFPGPGRRHGAADAAGPTPGPAAAAIRTPQHSSLLHRHADPTEPLSWALYHQLAEHDTRPGGWAAVALDESGSARTGRPVTACGPTHILAAPWFRPPVPAGRIRLSGLGSETRPTTRLPVPATGRGATPARKVGGSAPWPLPLTVQTLTLLILRIAFRLSCWLPAILHPCPRNSQTAHRPLRWLPFGRAPIHGLSMS